MTAVTADSQLEPWCDLRGKVVLVTGASSGLGREFALDLARAGCRVVAAARRVDRLQSLCDEINVQTIASDGLHRRAVAVEMDVSTDGGAIDAAVQRAWEAFGRVDALINNAGVRGSIKNPLEYSEEEWNHEVKTNTTGTWLVSKSAMARELGVYRIRVNSISPGIFQSEITKGLMQKDWLKQAGKRTLPLQTYGTVDPALTSIIRYLIHDSSQYVTGNMFLVDAGATIPGVPIFSSL
ncbi:unnamed protein product [Linum tenue]|uniref:Uncharacterized protein n=1 Tax=Linum tenue TaxID=586396 RepID=A0AAV0QFT5_9ROSI|nr:unnamed protein product [Linum tenue]CAI0629103.1 unnamed protein product [Linum tenue]